MENLKKISSRMVLVVLSATLMLGLTRLSAMQDANDASSEGGIEVEKLSYEAKEALGKFRIHLSAAVWGGNLKNSMFYNPNKVAEAISDLKNACGTKRSIKLIEQCLNEEVHQKAISALERYDSNWWLSILNSSYVIYNPGCEKIVKALALRN